MIVVRLKRPILKKTIFIQIKYNLSKLAQIKLRKLLTEDLKKPSKNSINNFYSVEIVGLLSVFFVEFLGDLNMLCVTTIELLLHWKQKRIYFATLRHRKHQDHQRQIVPLTMLLF